METEWTVDKNQSLPDDELLACLMLLAKYYKNPCSASVLITGLPLEENRLVPSIFERAAERANLTSKLAKRKLNAISTMTLPAVLLLSNKEACLLIDIKRDEAEIIIPHAGEGVTKIKLKDLDSRYLGHVIFVRPIQEKAKRGDQIVDPIKEHWLWAVFRKSLPIYGQVILASFLINVFALAVPLFTRVVYDRILPNSAFETLWVLVSGLAIVFVFDFILKTLRSYFVDHASRATDIRLSSIIFSQTMGIKMAARPNSIGAFANSIQSFEFFRDFITSTTVTVLVDIPFFVIFILVLFYIGGPVIGSIPLVMVPIVLIVSLMLNAPLRRLIQRSYTYGAEKHAVLYESLSGAETIKTENAEGHMQGRWERIVGLAANLGNRLRVISNFGLNFSAMAQQVTSIAIVIAGVYLVSENKLTSGGLIACMIIGGRALVPITQAALLLTKYFQAQSALESLNKIMHLPGERSDEKRPLHLAKLKGNIVFNKVSFLYQPNSPPALKNLSFKITAGEKVGIIGRLGSGKTTVAKLILGLYQAHEGSVLLDDIEINQLDFADVRRNIGYVPQDITLFNTTIRENIILRYPEAEDSEILKAIDVSGVNLFTKSHPQGLDREIGENGKYLSGGQRQAIVIARAVIANPEIFIFDEPTNSMDDNSELYFINKFQENYADKTLILITHRASMLKLVDRLIVLDQGMVIADGPKEKVIEALKSKSLHAKAE